MVQLIFYCSSEAEGRVENYHKEDPKMPLLKKVTALTVAVCFLLTNITYADINSFKLAVPSKFGRMQNLEFKEAAQIRLGILEALKNSGPLSISTLQTLNQYRYEEKTVFGSKITATIDFSNAAEGKVSGEDVHAAGDCYIFKATGKGRFGTATSYYCLLSKSNSRGQYSVSVISKRAMDEVLAKGTVQFTHKSIDAEDKTIIDRYTAHEITTANNEAIDPWIAKRMSRGNFAVDSQTALLPLYNKAGRTYDTTLYPALMAECMHFLSLLGAKQNEIDAIRNAMLSKPLVFIPYKRKADLPKIVIGKETISVNAHSSESATYIFLEQSQYNKITANKPESDYDKNFREIVLRRLTHEIGARCGLNISAQFTVEKGTVMNYLDFYYGFYDFVYHGKYAATAKGIPGSINSPLVPQNLLALELRNDYAAGEVTPEQKESRSWRIFKRVMYPLLVLAATVGIVKHYISKEKPAEVKEEAVEPRIEEGKDAEFYSATFTVDGVLTKHILIHDSKIYRVSRQNIDMYTFDRETGTIEITYFEAPARVETIAPGEGYYKEAIAEMAQIMERIGDCQIGIGGEQENQIIRRRHSFLLECSGYLGVVGQSNPVAKVEAMLNPHIIEEKLEETFKPIPMVEEKPTAVIRKPMITTIDNTTKNVDTLLDELESKDWLLRHSAALELGNRIGCDKRIVPALIDVLKNTRSDIRSEAAKGLGTTKDKIAIDALVATLRSKNIETALEEAIQWAGLGKIGEPAIPALIVALRNEIDAFVQDRLVGALVAIGKPAVEPVVCLLNDSDWMIRARALNVLYAMGSYARIYPPAVKFDSLLTYRTPSTPEFIAALKQKAAIALVEAMNDKENNIISTKAIRSLGAMGKNAEEAVPELIRNLRKHNSFDTGAATALGEICDARAIQPLIAMLEYLNNQPKATLSLQYEKIRLRESVMKALGRFGLKAKAAAPHIINAYRNAERPDMITCRKAVEALGLIGERKLSIPALLSALNDEDSFVRGDAAYALVLLKAEPKDTVPHLIKALRSGWWGLSGAAYALGEIRDEQAIGPLLRALDDYGYAKLPTLYEKDTVVRKEIVVALGKYGPSAKEALPKLKEVAETDEAQEVREAAKKAIQQIKTATNKTSQTDKTSEQRLVKEVIGALTIRLWEGRGAIHTANPQLDDKINAAAAMALPLLGAPWAFSKPEDGDIRAIGTRIKDADIEVFIRQDQFRKDGLSRIRKGVDDVFGDRVRTYNNLSDVPGMIKNPGKSIVMTVGLGDEEVKSAKDSFANLKDVRFMNFEAVDIDAFIKAGVYDNYIQDMLNKLLVARIITKDEAKQPNSTPYRLMAHFLSGHIDSNLIDDYIRQIADNEMDVGLKMSNLVKWILRAMTIAAYADDYIKPANQVLWSV